ncbi:MAG: ChbG/HpnK family deacetylase [Nanoarchaeota archaeon]
MKYLIVNADDFGLSELTNEGIIKGHREGIVTSTSIMANMPAFLHAVKLARRYKALGVGVHLNLTTGKPLSGNKSLCNEKGEFHPDNLKRLLKRNLSIWDIENELRMQIRKVKESKIRITHLDGHKHIHVLPKVRKVIVKLSREYGIKYVRLPYERFSDITHFSLKKYVVNFSARASSKLWKAHGLAYPDHFFGTTYTGKANYQNLYSLVSSVKDGVNEIMVHPGLYDKALESKLTISREIELRALMSPGIRQGISKFYIRLINFGDLNEIH